MYSSATFLTSPFNLSFRKPGGKTCKAAGDLFWMTTTELRSLVTIFENPEKSWTMVPRWESRYGREYEG